MTCKGDAFNLTLALVLHSKPNRKPTCFFVCALEPTLVGGRGLEIQTPPARDQTGLREFDPLYFIFPHV